MLKETTDCGVMWRCADCGHQTKFRTSLFEHCESKHTVSSGYLCQYCQKYCRTRNALRSHVNRQHSLKYTLKPWFSAVVEMKMWKETTADRGLIWRCADCDYTAKLKRGMFEHVESKHVGSQGYTCLYCGKHCPSKNALRSHVSRNHPKS